MKGAPHPSLEIFLYGEIPNLIFLKAFIWPYLLILLKKHIWQTGLICGVFELWLTAEHESTFRRRSGNMLEHPLHQAGLRRR